MVEKQAKQLRVMQQERQEEALQKKHGAVQACNSPSLHSTTEAYPC